MTAITVTKPTNGQDSAAIVASYTIVTTKDQGTTTFNWNSVSSTYSTASVTTTAANEALVAMAVDASGVTSFTSTAAFSSTTTLSLPVSGVNFTIEDKIVSSTGTYSDTGNLGGVASAYGYLVTFK